MKLENYIAPVILVIITVMFHFLCIATWNPVVQILSILAYLCISMFVVHFSCKNSFYFFKFYVPYITGAAGIMLIFLVLGESGNGILFLYLLLFFPIPLLLLTMIGFFIDKRLKRGR